MFVRLFNSILQSITSLYSSLPSKSVLYKSPTRLQLSLIESLLSDSAKSYWTFNRKPNLLFGSSSLVNRSFSSLRSLSTDPFISRIISCFADRPASWAVSPGILFFLLARLSSVISHSSHKNYLQRSAKWIIAYRFTILQEVLLKSFQITSSIMKVHCRILETLLYTIKAAKNSIKTTTFRFLLLTGKYSCLTTYINFVMFF